jgi:GDP-L-fucose synthase
VKSNREYPDDFLRVNLEIQRNVFNACVDFDVKRLVFVGTSCLYPKHAPLPVVEESLLTGPFEPDVEAYAVAKLAGYEFCKAQYDQHGRNYSTVAPCNLYGLGDNYGPSAHVIPALIARVHDCLQTGSPLVVWGDGSAIREFLFADDAADAIGYVLEGWNKPDIVNIGSSIGTSIQTLVKTILRVSGADLEVVWDTSKPVGIERKTFSTRKIQKLGWGPLVSLEVGLKKTWEDYINCKNVRSK